MSACSKFVVSEPERLRGAIGSSPNSTLRPSSLAQLSQLVRSGAVIRKIAAVWRFLSV